MSKMNLGTPPELNKLLAFRREADRWRHKNAIMSREANLRRQADIDRMRIDRFDELWKAAEFIFGWREWAAENDAVQDLFGEFGDARRLELFHGPFFNGEPRGKDDPAANARLVLPGNPARAGDGPAFVYEEYRNSSMGSSVRQTLEFRTVAELVSGVHPEFLLQAHGSLSGPDSWKFILDDLDPEHRRRGKRR